MCVFKDIWKCLCLLCGIRETEPEDILTDTFKTTKLASLKKHKGFHIHTCWTTNNIWQNKLLKELQQYITKDVGKDEADCIIALAEYDECRVEPCCNLIITNLRKDGIQLERVVIILCHKKGAQEHRYTDKSVAEIWHIDYGKHDPHVIEMV